MGQFLKKIIFCGIGCLFGGLVEGALTVADQQHSKKKLGLPPDATDSELRDAMKEANEKIELSAEELKSLEDLDSGIL